MYFDMPGTLRSLAAAAVLASTVVNAQLELVGTWTTKSRKVVTGPGFYDPVGERMFEPDLTGFSYSFTADGHYEEAYYRAVPNPTDPSCPQGIIQWQHGTYTQNSNGSISLTPIAVDGRQLLSDPCNNANAVYTRYHQPELFKTYEVLTDPYSKAQRLNLFAFDGSPLNPMYLAYQPPQMLPTVTLNPTATASGSGANPASATSTGGAKLRKRWHGGDDHLVEEKDLAVGERLRGNLKSGREPINADKWWWIGVGMTALGGVAYYSF